MKTFKQFLKESKRLGKNTVESEFYPMMCAHFNAHPQYTVYSTVYDEHPVVVTNGDDENVFNNHITYVTKDKYNLKEASKISEKLEDAITKEIQKQMNIFEKNMEAFYKKIGLIKGSEA